MNNVIGSYIYNKDRTKMDKMKDKLFNWKYLCIISIGALTLKVAAEQLVMLMRH